MVVSWRLTITRSDEDQDPLTRSAEWTKLMGTQTRAYKGRIGMT